MPSASLLSTSPQSSVCSRGCDQSERSSGGPRSSERKKQDDDCRRNCSELQKRRSPSRNVHSGSSSSSVYGVSRPAHAQLHSEGLGTVVEPIETTCNDCSVSSTGTAGAQSALPPYETLLNTHNNIMLQNAQPVEFPWLVVTESAGLHLDEDGKPRVRCAGGWGEHIPCIKFDDIADNIRKEAGSLTGCVLTYPVFERRNRRPESGYEAVNDDVRTKVKKINRRVFAVISDSGRSNEETGKRYGVQTTKRHSRPRQRGYRRASHKQERRYTSSPQVDVERLNEAVDSLMDVLQTPERAAAKPKLPTRTDHSCSPPSAYRVISPSLDDTEKVETVCNILESVTGTMKDARQSNIELLVIDARSRSRNYMGRTPPQQTFRKRQSLSKKRAITVRSVPSTRVAKPAEEVTKVSALPKRSTSCGWRAMDPSNFKRNPQQERNEECEDEEYGGDYEGPDRSPARRMKGPPAVATARSPGALAVSVWGPTLSSPQRKGKDINKKEHTLICSSRGMANPDLHETESMPYAEPDELGYEDLQEDAISKNVKDLEADVCAEDDSESKDGEDNQEKASRARSENRGLRKAGSMSPLGRKCEEYDAEPRKTVKRGDGVNVMSTSTVINSDIFSKQAFCRDHRDQTRKNVDVSSRAGTDHRDRREVGSDHWQREHHQDKRPNDRSTRKGSALPNDRRETEGERRKRDASDDTVEADKGIRHTARGVRRREVGGNLRSREFSYESRTNIEGDFKGGRRASERRKGAENGVNERVSPSGYNKGMDTPPEYRRDGFWSREPSSEGTDTESPHEYVRNVKGDIKGRPGRQFSFEYRGDIKDAPEGGRSSCKNDNGRDLRGGRSPPVYRGDAEGEPRGRESLLDYRDTETSREYLRGIEGDSKGRQSPSGYRRGSERDLRSRKPPPALRRVTEGEFRDRESSSDCWNGDSSRESCGSAKGDFRGGQHQRDIEDGFRSREPSLDHKNAKGNDITSTESSHECHRSLDGDYRGRPSAPGYRRDTGGDYRKRRPPVDYKSDSKAEGPWIEYNRATESEFRKTELPHDYGQSIEDSFEGRERPTKYRSDFISGFMRGAPYSQCSERDLSDGSQEQWRRHEEGSIRRVNSSEEDGISAENHLRRLTSSPDRRGGSRGQHSKPPSPDQKMEAIYTFRRQPLRDEYATHKNVIGKRESSLGQGLGHKYASGGRKHSQEEWMDVMHSLRKSGPSCEQRVDHQWIGNNEVLRSPRGGTLRQSPTGWGDIIGPVRKDRTISACGFQSRQPSASRIRSPTGTDTARETAACLEFCPAPQRVSLTNMPCPVQERTVSNDDFGLPRLPQEKILGVDAGYVPSQESSQLYLEGQIVKDETSNVETRRQVSRKVSDAGEEGPELDISLRIGRRARTRSKDIPTHTDEGRAHQQTDVERSRSRGIILRVYSDEDVPAKAVTGKPCLDSETKPELFGVSMHDIDSEKERSKHSRTCARRKSKSRSRSSRKIQPESVESTTSTTPSMYDDCKSKFDDEPILKARSSPIPRINVWHIPKEDLARHLASVVPMLSSTSQSEPSVSVCARSMSKHSRSGHTGSKQVGSETPEPMRRWPASTDPSAQRQTSLELCLQRPPSRQRLCRRHRAPNLTGDLRQQGGEGELGSGMWQSNTKRIRQGAFSVELLGPPELEDSQPPHLCARLKQTQPGMFSLMPAKAALAPGISEVTATIPGMRYPGEMLRMPVRHSFVVQDHGTRPVLPQVVDQAPPMLRHLTGQAFRPGAQTFVLPGEHGKTVVTVLTKTPSATRQPTGQARVPLLVEASKSPSQQFTLPIRGDSQQIITELVPLQLDSLSPEPIQQTVLIQPLPLCEPLEQQPKPSEQEPGQQQRATVIKREFEYTFAPSGDSVTRSHSQSLPSESDNEEAGDTTGSLWQTDAADEWDGGRAGSTDLMLPKKERYRSRLPMASRRLSDKGQSAFLIALAVVVLTGLTGALSLYFKREHAPEEGEDTFERGEGASMIGPRQRHDDAGSVAPNITRSCMRLQCSTEALALTRTLDRSVMPCEDFYGFVCSSHSKSKDTHGSVDAVVVEDIERAVVAYFREGSVAVPDVAASRQFWRDCIDVEVIAQLGNDPFESILNMTGLRGWPYAADNHQSDALEPWKVAGKILRLLYLSPLLTLQITHSLRRQNKEVVLSHGEDVPLTHRELHKHIARDFLTADVLKAILVIHRTGFKHDEVATEVVDFVYKLSNLTEAEEKRLAKLSPATKVFITSAFSEDNFLHSKPTVDAALVSKSVPDVIRLVSSTPSRIVLNYLGFSVVRHTFLFTPSSAKEVLSYGKKSPVAASRETVCARSLLNNALPKNVAEHVSYIALKSNIDLPALHVLVGDIKRSLVTRVSKLNWVDGTSRARVTRHLSEIDIRFFFEDNPTSTSSTRTGWHEGGPDITPSEALLSYQRLRAHRFRSSLTNPFDGFNNWSGSFSHPDCTYYAGRRVLLLPLATLYVKEPPTTLSLLFQVPRFGVKVLRCLLRVLLGGNIESQEKTPSLRNGSWASPIRRHCEAIRPCLDKQYVTIRDPVENNVVDRQDLLAALNVIDNAVIGPGRDVYEVYGRTLRHTGGAQENETLEGVTWSQLFYVSYGRGMCEALDHELNFRRAMRLHESPNRERVNIPLGNDDDFMKTFKCSGNSAMNREPRCRIWR